VRISSAIAIGGFALVTGGNLKMKGWGKVATTLARGDCSTADFVFGVNFDAISVVARTVVGLQRRIKAAFPADCPVLRAKNVT